MFARVQGRPYLGLLCLGFLRLPRRRFLHSALGRRLAAVLLLLCTLLPAAQHADSLRVSFNLR